ncbi:hypothetical protein [Micromonospora sp. NBS 11-29]|uniref:hypothetical protein n=1 Tax=Micromonospora sp. NBS 11-29 TaxID=1960879 RepID=UPI000B78FD4A|nr:hypothetical protein [Micromonospora sp. NBS 11-29]
MSRILALELRRSAAIGAGGILAVVGTLLLYFAEGIGFATGWMQLAMTQRLYLALLWPLALAAGAWQARREHRSDVEELFASTPRPRPLRTAPTLGALAIGVVSGYLAMAVAGGVWIVDTAGYLPAAVFTVAAVGALALIAAAWLGLAVGRLLPSPVTAPALAVAGLALLLLLPAMTRPRGWLALVFSPIYEMNMPDAYATVPGRVSAAQAVWLAALAVAAVLLFAFRSRRVGVAALVPLAAGAALAITVVPHRDRVVTDAVDPVAQELVCADDGPRVCVSRVHAGLLAEVVAPAREGLAMLARLPAAPTRVHEDTSTYPDRHAPWAADVVLLPVEAGTDGRLDRADTVAADVVAAAFDGPPGCENRIGYVDRLAAAAYLTGRDPVGGEFVDPAEVAAARQLGATLRGLPAGEAESRLAALHRAAVTCSAVDGLLTGSAR